MTVQEWTFLLVGLSFALYIWIAYKSRASSTSEFYVAGKGVNPVVNGMATAADWMSAASFLSMAGLIAFMGKDGAIYLMGWTGGYVLLALLLAPYLRKFGKYTVPEFIGERYYSDAARVVAVLCLVFISFTYIAGQMRGVGIVFSRFLEVDINMGIFIGMAIVFVYAVWGGMKGITYTQVAQYTVLIFAYLVPAVYISIIVTNNPIPQLGFGDTLVNGSEYLLEKLDRVTTDLGFVAYTQNTKSMIDIFCITAALMFGTAGLPHVIVRFFTVPSFKDARKSAGYALIFIALLYTTAPAVSAFARMNLIDSIQDVDYVNSPQWFKNWEEIGLIAWKDKNQDGKIRYSAGTALEDTKPKYLGQERGSHGERLLVNPPNNKNDNEVYIDRDIIVLANPEIAKLPFWVIALVAAGGVAAALSTAAGLLITLSAAVSHDLLKKTFMPQISEKKELLYSRLATAAAIGLAGAIGVMNLAFVAQVVAFAFGLAASTLFPVLLLGVFYKRLNKEGAIAGMLIGLIFTLSYIIYFKFMNPELNSSDYWLLGISPEGIGFLGMLLNLILAITVSSFTKPPPEDVMKMVDSIRSPQ